LAAVAVAVVVVVVPLIVLGSTLLSEENEETAKAMATRSVQPATSTSTSTQVAPATPTPAAGTYTIKEGDIPLTIAEQFGVSIEALLEANDITDPNSLKVGQVLVIPTPTPISPTQVSQTQLGENVWQCQTEQCIADEARAAGMSTEAVAFFSEYDLFLRQFEEKGRVDWGWVNHPIQDQGRGTGAFLNGTPSVLTVGAALGCVSDLASDAMHGCLEYGPEARLWAWSQYGTLQSVVSDASGQTFVVAIPLSEGRASQTERQLEVAFRFDGAGRYLGRGLSQ
jgi:LysM repeat protein